MQCANWMWFIFSTYSPLPVVHTLLPSVLQRLDSRGIKALILILEKLLKCRYDLIIGPILLPNQVCFLCWGTEKSQMLSNQVNMEGDQPVVFKVSSHCNHGPVCRSIVLVCPGETGLPSSVFQAVSEMSLVLLFKVLNYLSSVDLSQGNNVVSIRKGWIQCMPLISLLWHYSFLVSLWTFQPTLVGFCQVWILLDIVGWEPTLPLSFHCLFSPSTSTRFFSFRMRQLCRFS